MTRITNNWSLKLISVVLAVLLWSHVRGEVNPLETVTVDVPLRVRAPRGFVLTNTRNVPAKVSVILRGPRNSLRNVKGGTLAEPLTPNEQAAGAVGSVRASLDWTDARVGEQGIPIEVLSNIDDVEALGAKPPEITVVLARADEKALPVAPRSDSKAARDSEPAGASDF